jgi:hypothetical protein
MITCNFSGGLGNNIFQLANLYNLHKKYGVEYMIPDYVNRNNIERYNNQCPDLEFKTLFDNKFNYSNNINYPSYNKYNHSDFNGKFEYSSYNFTDNTCYNGYFQSDKYFTDFDIRSEFILNRNIRQSLLLKYETLFSKKTISIHYRLAGDRVESSVQTYHKNVSVDFYKSSLDMIKSSVGNIDDYNIILFSDDIHKATDILKETGYNIIPIVSDNNIEDFIMMTLCDFNIIGNSTFSWWAAYLNEKGSTVFAPKTEWFGSGYKNYILDDLFPNNWITI